MRQSLLARLAELEARAGGPPGLTEDEARELGPASPADQDALCLRYRVRKLREAEASLEGKRGELRGLLAKREAGGKLTGGEARKLSRLEAEVKELEREAGAPPEPPPPAFSEEPPSHLPLLLAARLCQHAACEVVGLTLVKADVRRHVTRAAVGAEEGGGIVATGVREEDFRAAVSEASDLVSEGLRDVEAMSGASGEEGPAGGAQEGSMALAVLHGSLLVARLWLGTAVAVSSPEPGGSGKGLRAVVPGRLEPLELMDGTQLALRRQGKLVALDDLERALADWAASARGVLSGDPARLRAVSDLEPPSRLLLLRTYDRSKGRDRLEELCPGKKPDAVLDKKLLAGVTAREAERLQGQHSTLLRHHAERARLTLEHLDGHDLFLEAESRPGRGPKLQSGSFDPSCPSFSLALHHMETGKPDEVPPGFAHLAEACRAGDLEGLERLVFEERRAVLESLCTLAESLAGSCRTARATYADALSRRAADLAPPGVALRFPGEGEECQGGDSTVLLLDNPRREGLPEEQERDLI